MKNLCQTSCGIQQKKAKAREEDCHENVVGIVLDLQENKMATES